MISNKRWMKHVHSVNVVLGFVCQVHKMYEDVGALIAYMIDKEASAFDDLRLNRFYTVLEEFFDKHVNTLPEHMNTEYLYEMKVDLNELLSLTFELSQQVKILNEMNQKKYDNLESLNEMIENISEALVNNKKLEVLLGENSDNLSRFNLNNDVKRMMNCFDECNGIYVNLLSKLDDVIDLNDKKNELIMCVSVFNQDLCYFEKSIRLQIQYIEEFIDVLNKESNLMIDRLFEVPSFIETLLNLQKVVADE